MNETAKITLPHPPTQCDGVGGGTLHDAPMKLPNPDLEKYKKNSGGLDMDLTTPFTLEVMTDFNEIYQANRIDINEMIAEPARQFMINLEFQKSGEPIPNVPGDNFNKMLMKFCSAYNYAIESWHSREEIANLGFTKVDVPKAISSQTLFALIGVSISDESFIFCWKRVRERFSAPLLSASKPKKSSEKTLPQYAFKHNGDIWNIVFEGHELQHVRHLVGMTYIAELIKAKGMPISAADLYRIEHPPTGEALDAAHKDKDEIAMAYGTGGGAQKVYDAKTKAAIKQRIGEIQLLMKEADTPADLREVLEEELEKLEANSRAAGLKTGNGYESGASFEPPEIKQARQAVGTAIGRAIEAIDKATKDKELVRHLNNGFNRMSASPKYMGGFDWEL